MVILRADPAAVGESRPGFPAPFAVEGLRQDEDQVVVQVSGVGDLPRELIAGSMEAEAASSTRVVGLPGDDVDPAARTGNLEIFQEIRDHQWMGMTEVSDR